MSSGGSSRVSIPSSVKKTVKDIKEIARNHTDDEIYAMLQECSMDPNETAQKLLFQDTFHEVKRKRDKRRENLNNREPTDSRWKFGMQGRGIRGGGGNYYSRHPSHDAGGINAVKEDGPIQPMEKGITSPSFLTTQEMENKLGISASGSVPGTANAPTKLKHVNSSLGSGSQMTDGGCFPLGGGGSNAETTQAGCTLPPPVDTKNVPVDIVSVAHIHAVPTSNQFPSVMTASDPGVHVSGPDAALLPSSDTHVSGLVCTIKHEVVIPKTVMEPAIGKVGCISHGVSGSEVSSEKTSSEVVSSSIQGNVPAKSQGLEVSHLSDASEPLSSTFQSGSSGSKPSSNFSSRPQQVIDPQKVAPIMEWKPKSMNQIPAQASSMISTSSTANATVETDAQFVSVASSEGSEETMSKIQKKLQEVQFSDSHVIIPNHLQVPEAERSGLSFGSFDASFGIRTRSIFPNDVDVDSEKSSTPLTLSSQGPEENIEEPISSTENASPLAEEQQYPEHPQSPSHMQEDLSTRVTDNSLNISVVPGYEQSEQASGVGQGDSQFAVVHTSPAYSAFGLIPPVLGSQLSPYENCEPQARETSRVTSFIVQQPFDPSSYYPQIYRPGADGDGRFSPFSAHGASTKYSGNPAGLSPQAGQSTEEGANSLVLPTTAVATQAAGVVQTSVAVTQQPVPVFRQPAGVHMPHYPTNYLPYGPYFSPFYVPAPTIHHFFGNTAFPQQPLAGSVYPPPAAISTAPLKYSLSHYKSGTNSGNSTHAVVPTGHGPYSSSLTGYSLSPTVSSGNSTLNEDHSVSQCKENNAYATGQQSEGSAFWIPAPGRDIPSVQAGSFYNLPHGQHTTFPSPQAGNGAFAGIYHPTQSVGAAPVNPMLQPSQTMAGAVEMVGPPASVYQQPQRVQINWAGNY